MQIGLRNSSGFIGIKSLGSSWIEFWLELKILDWFGLRRVDFQPNCISSEIENFFFRIDSD